MPATDPDPGEAVADGDVDGRLLDGNEAAGLLAELFTVDLAAATVTCAHCGSATALAEHDVYTDAPAMVVRCRGCSGVVLRFAADRWGLRLEMTGIALLAIPTRVDD